MTGQSATRGALLIAVLTIVTGAVALITGGGALGTICALSLILILPGAAFAFYAPLEATRPERGALMLTLGIASLILVSIALAAIGVRLDATTWILVLVNLSIVGCLVTLLVSPLGRATPVRNPRRVEVAVQLRPGTVVPALAVLLLLAAAAVVTIESKHSQDRDAQFTQLWTVPEAGKGAVTIGIGNRETGVRSYSVQAESDGRRIASWGPVNIAPGKFSVWRLQTPVGTNRIHVVLQGSGEGKIIHRSTSLTVG